jgi:patatin-like phospholipase/acyl hydrolase
VSSKKLGLSLAGGGTSGYITASILEKIETEFGISIVEEFDIIAGVSTGSIIGSLLVSGYSPSDIKKLYIKLYNSVFGAKKNYFKLLFGTFYENEKLENALHELIGDARMSASKIKFMCHAIKINEPVMKPKFWKSWLDGDVLLRKAVTASSCAPYVFGPFKIDNDYFYDGGLVANEPSMPLVAEIHSMNEQDNYKILSLQTDYNEGFKNPSKVKGVCQLITKLLTMCVDGSERSSEYMARNIMKENYKNLNPNCYFDITSNDWDGMDKYIEILWEEERDNLKKFLLT